MPPVEPTIEAASLKDLLLIRHQNRDIIYNVTGGLGSALGHKKASDLTHPDNGKPAIIIFVRKKIAPKWLPVNQKIPAKMKGPNGLECPVDVIEGGMPDDYPLLFDSGKDANGDQLAPEVVWSLSLQPLPPLDKAQLAMRDRLRGWDDKIMPGAQIATQNAKGTWSGTLACFVKDRTTGTLGLLTNQHVAKGKGQSLHIGSVAAKKIALTERSVIEVKDENRFSGLIDEDEAYYRVDCAFAKLDPALDPNTDIETSMPFLDKKNRPGLLQIGAPLPLDLDTMGPLKKDVFGVGRTMSFQRGKIVGFAYEYKDAANYSLYCDYLIVGEDGTYFSAPGDSGKLILTDEKVPRPVALLWGGRMEKLSNQNSQQDWTWAIDINFILDTLNVDIFSG